MKKLYEAIETIANHCKETRCRECVFKCMGECPGSWMAKDTTFEYSYSEWVDSLLDSVRTAMKG